MSSNGSFLKPLQSNLTARKNLHKGMKNLNSTIKDNKILLAFNFLWVLPYLPSHLSDRFPEDNICFWKFLTLLVKAFKTLLAVVVLIYSNLLFPGNKPLALTFNLFAIFSLSASWCMFFKRQRVLKAIQMVLIVTSQVTPRTFKSKWNVYLHGIFGIIGTAVFSISVGLTGIQTYNNMNVTSSTFFGFDITDEYNSVYRLSLVVVATASFIFCAIACGLTTLLCSTAYFHVGDVVLNFGMKLKKRFEYHPADKQSMSENLSMFDKITELVHVVNDAFSVSVLCVYGAMMSIFFIGICAFRTYDTADASLIILLMSMFGFALYCFFSLTITGDRIARKHVELREMLVSCSNITIGSEHSEKAIACFSLMTTEMRSAELYVTGGDIFTICNGLILSVAGAMITYGVLIVQMN